MTSLWFLLAAVLFALAWWFIRLDRRGGPREEEVAAAASSLVKRASTDPFPVAHEDDAAVSDATAVADSDQSATEKTVADTVEATQKVEEPTELGSKKTKFGAVAAGMAGAAATVAAAKAKVADATAGSENPASLGSDTPQATVAASTSPSEPDDKIQAWLQPRDFEGERATLQLDDYEFGIGAPHPLGVEKTARTTASDHQEFDIYQGYYRGRDCRILVPVQGGPITFAVKQDSEASAVVHLAVDNSAAPVTGTGTDIPVVVQYDDMVVRSIDRGRTIAVCDERMDEFVSKFPRYLDAVWVEGSWAVGVSSAVAPECEHWDVSVAGTNHFGDLLKAMPPADAQTLASRPAQPADPTRPDVSPEPVGDTAAQVTQFPHTADVKSPSAPKITPLNYSDAPDVSEPSAQSQLRLVSWPEDKLDAEGTEEASGGAELDDSGRHRGGNGISFNDLVAKLRDSEGTQEPADKGTQS